MCVNVGEFWDGDIINVREVGAINVREVGAANHDEGWGSQRL